MSVRERAEQLRLTERAGARAEQLQVHEQLLHIEAEQCASVAQWKSRPDAPSRRWDDFLCENDSTAQNDLKSEYGGSI